MPIGAEVDDAPNSIYASMGFAPTCLTQAWRRGPDRGEVETPPS